MIFIQTFTEPEDRFMSLPFSCLADLVCFSPEVFVGFFCLFVLVLV